MHETLKHEEDAVIMNLAAIFLPSRSAITSVWVDVPWNCGNL